jgi:signal transduction histidine kinase
MDTVRLRADQPLEFRPAPMDLVATVAVSVEDALRASPSHPIHTEFDRPALFVNADGPRLERVIRNILDNAIKYSPDGAGVTVGLRRDVDPSGAWAVLTIEDRGIGVPESDLPFIFERFRRGVNVAGRIAGSGIGLTGAQQIVAQHGGTIAVESAEGQGSTFTLRLPLHSTSPADP